MARASESRWGASEGEVGRSDDWSCGTRRSGYRVAGDGRDVETDIGGRRKWRRGTAVAELGRESAFPERKRLNL